MLALPFFKNKATPSKKEQEKLQDYVPKEDKDLLNATGRSFWSTSEEKTPYHTKTQKFNDYNERECLIDKNDGV